MIFLCYLLICYYAYQQGRAHAMLYSLKGANSFSWNEHRTFTLERAAVLSLPLFSTLINTEDAIILMASAMLSFPFWHNGAYYTTRHDIDTPKYGWFSQSQSSTAKHNFSPTLRTILFFSSILLMTIWIWYGTHK